MGLGEKPSHGWRLNPSTLRNLRKYDNLSHSKSANA